MVPLLCLETGCLALHLTYPDPVLSVEYKKYRSLLLNTRPIGKGPDKLLCLCGGKHFNPLYTNGFFLLE